jgi:hypothetical protein
MPRKNTPGCGPCCDTTCGPLTVQVRGCNGLVLPGAAVTATQAGYPDVAGTTDAAGRVALTMPACGGWTLHVADGLATPRFGDPAQFVSMPGGPQAVTVTPTPLVDAYGSAAFHCVPDCLFPVARTLFLTDPQGTVTLTWTPLTASIYSWYGCAVRTIRSTITTASCTGALAAGGTTAVVFKLSFTGGTTATLDILVPANFNGTAFRIIRGVACAAVAVDPAGNLHWQDTCAQINATLNTSQVNLTRNCPVAAAFAFSGSTTLSQIYGATAVPITGSE